MRFRQRVVEYAIKHNNNAKAARRYHTTVSKYGVGDKDTMGLYNLCPIRAEGLIFILTNIHKRSWI